MIRVNNITDMFLYGVRKQMDGWFFRVCDTCEILVHILLSAYLEYSNSAGND